MMRDRTDPLDILLVEDSPGDIRLTREALMTLNVENRLNVVSDGEQAIEFLRRRGRHADAPIPKLILLDLNLPRMSGREVLAEVKSDASLRLIPIVVLTTSDAEGDVQECYRLHANSYVTKPVDSSTFFQVISEISNYWFKLVKLPCADTAAMVFNVPHGI